MSATHQRQPTAVAAPDATVQGPVVTPNQYHLAGYGISVSYFPDGFGPIPEDGPDRLFYQDAAHHLVFNGSEIRKVDVADLGTILSVTIVRTVDVGSTSFLSCRTSTFHRDRMPPPRSIRKRSRRCTERLPG